MWATESEDDVPDTRERAAGSQIAVLPKAVAVLDALVDAPDGLTPGEVAERTGTNRSTAFRLVATLETTGLVDRDAGSGRYRLGMKMLRYGAAVRAGLALVRIAEPVLLALRDDTAQTTLLAIGEDRGARCVLRLPGTQVDVVSWTSGQWAPLHAGAAPRALLAGLPDAELEAYLADAATPGLARTVGRARALVDADRERGYTLDTGVAGLASLGVLVRNRAGVAVCAIAVAGLEHGYSGNSLTRLATRVRAAAADIARQLSG